MTNNTISQNSTITKTGHGYTVHHAHAAVTYDRSARQYIVANGREIGRFPAGEGNRVKAEWLALSYNDGRLYSAAMAQIAAGHCEARTLRAAQLVLSDRVIEHYHEDNDSRALVAASQGNRSPVTGQDLYHVYHNLKWSCDCEDWQGRREAGEAAPICKHVLAVKLIEYLNGDDLADFEVYRRREEEALIERRQAQMKEARAACANCRGRGTAYRVDPWSGQVRLGRCDCQIDF